jgi:hypothetical protein
MSLPNRKNTCQFKIHEDYKLTPEDKKLFDRQEHMCYICNCELNLNIEDIIKTPCSHIYHYECFYYTIYANKTNGHKNLNTHNILECPYCRTYIGSYLPIFKTNEYKFINGVNINIFEPLLCEEILKSGKRKGEKCGCVVKNTTQNTNLCCGRHKNSNKKINNFNSTNGYYISI